MRKNSRLPSLSIDPAVSAGKALERAGRAYDRTWGARDRLEGNLRAAGVLPKMPSIMIGRHQSLTVGDVLAHGQPRNPNGPNEETTRAIAAEMRKRESAYRRARRAVGLEPLDRATEEAHKAFFAARHAIATTRAESLAGLLVKLSLLAKDAAVGQGPFFLEIARSARADAKRLAELEAQRSFVPAIAAE